MCAVVCMRQLMGHGIGRSATCRARGPNVVARAVGNRCRDRIAVVNIRQEAFYRCDEHAEQRDERACAAEQRSEWHSPTRHERDT